MNNPGGDTHVYVRIGGYENVRSATGRGRGGQNLAFFAYVLYGWPLSSHMGTCDFSSNCEKPPALNG